MKVVRMPMGHCAVIQHDPNEQFFRGGKGFGAVFWDSDEDKFQIFTDFDTVEEACAFLDVIDWDFDYYEPKEILFVREMIRRVESRR